MQELVGRLTALDPDASASLKVIVYFDSLVEGHAGIEAFLRGAAVLTGCPAGVHYPERRLRMRVDADGVRDADAFVPVPERWESTALGYSPDAAVWIEREGPAHANDPMVLERLAWGLRMTLERAESELPADRSEGVEILIDPESQPGERHRAASRLHLNDSDLARVIAVPPNDTPTSQRALSSLMPTSVGPVRAVLEVSRPGRREPLPERAGIGPWVPVADLSESWKLAVIALRLTGPGAAVVNADDMGPAAVLASGIDAGAASVPEVDLLDHVTGTCPWAGPTLAALSENDSVRAAAAALGVHHSTVQSRCEQLEDLLGFSLRTQAGRNRVALGLTLQRLVHNRFH